MALKVWVGHYQDNPREWFVVWANNKDEAFFLIDGLSGEPDMDSLMELHAPGLVNFTVKYQKKDDYVSFFPPKEDVKGGIWIHFEEDVERNEDVNEYVLQVLRKMGER